MRKLLILYFSGAGATKRVAELMDACLSRNCSVDIFSVENAAKLDLNAYDALIVGTPVYHAAPSRVVAEYFRGVSPLGFLPSFLRG